MGKNHNQKLWDLCFESTSESIINEVINLIDHSIKSQTKWYEENNLNGEYQINKLKWLRECVSELVLEEVNSSKYYDYPYDDLDMDED